jgi:hypothetical protein
MVYIKFMNLDLGQGDLLFVCQFVNSVVVSQLQQIRPTPSNKTAELNINK